MMGSAKPMPRLGAAATEESMGLRLTLLGRGAWGGTLEQLWSAQGHQVRSWSRRDGGTPLPLLADCDLVVVAVSMVAVQPLAKLLQDHWPSDLPLLSCSKGIDLEGLCTASQLWRQHLSQAPLAVLSGPNLAEELNRGLPAASVIASHDGQLASLLQRELRTTNLRLYTNADPIGTEAAGALKNVMALAAGISDGLGLGANARASLLTRGLAEIGVVLEALGGQPATLYGLAGLGDLLATATSSLSRNQRCGALLASGLNEQQALERIGATVEGPRTARASLVLARRQGWRLPICDQVVSLLDGEIDAPGAVRALMERDLRPEIAEQRC
jgi:glycerol-3-phosphate dehydrogenase (NAD(P)+)